MKSAVLILITFASASFSSETRAQLFQDPGNQYQIELQNRWTMSQRGSSAGAVFDCAGADCPKNTRVTLGSVSNDSTLKLSTAGFFTAIPATKVIEIVKSMVGPTGEVVKVGDVRTTTVQKLPWYVGDFEVKNSNGTERGLFFACTLNKGREWVFMGTSSRQDYVVAKVLFQLLLADLKMIAS
jgi:hypothetical protein